MPRVLFCVKAALFRLLYRTVETTLPQITVGWDGFKELGALGHLSLWGPTQVRPI